MPVTPLPPSRFEVGATRETDSKRDDRAEIELGCETAILDPVQADDPSDEAQCVLCCNAMVGHLKTWTVCQDKCGSFCERCILRMCKKGKSADKYELSCPFCTTAWTRVVIYSEDEADLLFGDELMIDPKQKLPVYYTSEQTLNQILLLQGFYCPICLYDCEGQEQNEIFDRFDDLQRHCDRSHNMKFCKLCVENSNLFIDECMLYSHEDLANHRRFGSKSRDGVPAIKEHPRCHFHKKNFYDKEALVKHMTDGHLSCLFNHTREVERGKGQVEVFDVKIYFRRQDVLLEHLREYHFLCEYPECLQLAATMGSYVVFDDLMEFRLHLKRTHNEHVSARMSLDEIHAFQKRSLDIRKLRRNRAIQYIEHKRTQKNKREWKTQMEKITGEKIEAPSRKRALPDKCRDEELYRRRETLKENVYTTLAAPQDFKYYMFVTGSMTSGGILPEDYFLLHKRLFAFTGVGSWLDLFFELLRTCESGDRRIALYKAYEAWNNLPLYKQRRDDGPHKDPQILDVIKGAKQKHMFPSLSKNSKHNFPSLGKKAKKKAKSKSTTRVRSAFCDRPPDVDWRTTGYSQNESNPQSRANPQRRAPQSRAPPKPRGPTAGTPPRQVNHPLVESESWPGIGRLPGKRKTAVRGVWAVRSLASAEVKSHIPRARVKANNSWGPSLSQAPTAANVLKGGHKPAKPSGAGSWNGIPVKFKSKKKRKK